MTERNDNLCFHQFQLAKSFIQTVIEALIQLGSALCRLPSVCPTVRQSVGVSFCLFVFVGLPSQLLLILYIQISSLCTSGPRMGERTTVIFPNYGWLTSQPTSQPGTRRPWCLEPGVRGNRGYQVACEVLILKSVTLECAAQVTDQVGDSMPVRLSDSGTES